MSTEVAEHPPRGWTPDDRTFGARLALVRQKMGWGNVKAAAIACGVPAESWRTWERDGVEPRHIVTIAKQISGATGCNYLWLLVGPEGGDTRTTLVYRPEEHLVVTAGTERPHRPGRSVRQTHPLGGGAPRTTAPAAA